MKLEAGAELVRILILMWLGIPSCKEEYLARIEYNPCHEEIEEEIRLGEMELLAQLVQSEAGNQDLDGMRLVADTVLNRVDSNRFPNTIEEVIFDEYQFSPIKDGGFDEAAWNISENAYKAAEMEYLAERENRLDPEVLFFGTDKFNGTGFWKHGDHWFSY